jgi:hypothetical protein
VKRATLALALASFGAVAACFPDRGGHLKASESTKEPLAAAPELGGLDAELRVPSRVSALMLLDHRGSRVGVVECVPPVWKLPIDYDPITWSPIEFVVRNTRRGVVRITKVVSSCGCLDVQVASKTIGPREGSTVKVRIKARAAGDTIGENEATGDSFALHWQELAEGKLVEGVAVGVITYPARPARPGK